MSLPDCQMAEAFLNKLGNGEFYAESAGFEPAPLNPYAIRAMNEIGYDISKNTIHVVNDDFLEGRIYSIMTNHGKYASRFFSVRYPFAS